MQDGFGEHPQVPYFHCVVHVPSDDLAAVRIRQDARVLIPWLMCLSDDHLGTMHVILGAKALQ